MSILEPIERRVDMLSLFDIKLAQLSAVFLALILAKLVPEILQISLWWFIGLLILCAVRPVYVFFFKRKLV